MSKRLFCFYKGIRDTNLVKLRESTFHDEASEASDKVIAMLELYFPFMEELVDEFCEIEVKLVNYHSHIIDNFDSIELESYNNESERLSDLMGEKISAIEGCTIRYDAAENKLLTKRLRQIRNARHFRFTLNLVFTAQWFRLGGSVAHYLTRRYIA